MSQKHTDQKLLMRGLKYMVITLPLLFLCPYIITLSFLNKDNYTFYIFLAIGIIAGVFALFFFYKGIKTIMKSIF
jgi:hypothetical protein